MSLIHPQAYVDPHAELGRDVKVGAFAYVGPGVQLGDECVLHEHVTISGPAQIGPRNTFYPQCVIGSAPQDLKYKGGATRVIIGSDNLFREHVTVHRGTEVDQQSGGATRVGDHGLFMVGVHIAHDTRVDDHVILANYVQVAGHAHIQDHVNIGGVSAMHHFVTVGRYAFVGGMTRMTSDVPPYMKVSGYEATVRAVNFEGMRRWHVPDESIAAVKEAFRLLFARRSQRGVGRTAEAMARIEHDGLGRDEHVCYLIDFLKRQMHEGVFGRALERRRTDSAQDRAGFYRGQDSEQGK